jgi:hypothetical protein
VKRGGDAGRNLAEVGVGHDEHARSWHGPQARNHAKGPQAPVVIDFSRSAVDFGRA